MNKTHQHLIYLVVATDAGGFPSSVVTAWVTLVELEAIVRIPSHVEDGHTKGTLPWTRKRRGVGERRGGREEEEERKWKKGDEEREEERNEKTEGKRSKGGGVEEGQGEAFHHGRRSISFTQTHTSELSVRLLEVT